MRNGFTGETFPSDTRTELGFSNQNFNFIRLAHTYSLILLNIMSSVVFYKVSSSRNHCKLFMEGCMYLLYYDRQTPNKCDQSHITIVVTIYYYLIPHNFTHLHQRLFLKLRKQRKEVEITNVGHTRDFITNILT